MATLTEDDLQLFVDAVKHYLKATSKQEPEITSAFLGDSSVIAHEFNGIVSFMGGYSGQILVSMPEGMLRELLVLQHEHDLSETNLLDAVGEVANTLAGNARKVFGPDLEISVPTRLRGAQGITARVRPRPYVITFRWHRHPALVCVDLERR
ncbi:chemotaxis protein CheX [Pseudothauera nasutitermitis]|uniref:Chemotaxis protein CheX n=1 Tax=Pseudothauera nasutitermitis TaxID=2565930 RepID=A0A4V3WBM4_9RHOO|nr:chemotaxis protein CheX [Pseudothauera nasutitermitis]THF63813.1 chemotaxis protein CheX [Pseudothauera nasutitermitis]